MPSPPKPPKLKAAEPTYGKSFDAWNSSSTGHQRAENKLGASTGWRDSRSAKLQSQFRGGSTGGERMSDAVGAGSKDWDPEAQSVIPPELRARAKLSVMDMLVKPGTMSRGSTPAAGEGILKDGLIEEDRLMVQRKAEDEARGADRSQPRKIFDGVVVYVNGSTHPLISDHRLKQVLVEHGGRMSFHLGRKQVTHVIIGRPAGVGLGAGGGLAGGKLQKEIQRVGGRGVKFVSVEW
jgi:hypothetical protein